MLDRGSLAKIGDEIFDGIGNVDDGCFLELGMHVLEYVEEDMASNGAVVADEGFVEGGIVLCHLYNL